VVIVKTNLTKGREAHLVFKRSQSLTQRCDNYLLHSHG
jgi:hypothetical protein